MTCSSSSSVFFSNHNFHFPDFLISACKFFVAAFQIYLKYCVNILSIKNCLLFLEAFLVISRVTSFGNADFPEVSDNSCLALGIPDLSEWNMPTRVRFPLKTFFPLNERWQQTFRAWAMLINKSHLKIQYQEGMNRMPPCKCQRKRVSPQGTPPALRHISPFEKPCSLDGRLSLVLQVKGFNWYPPGPPHLHLVLWTSELGGAL